MPQRWESGGTPGQVQIALLAAWLGDNLKHRGFDIVLFYYFVDIPRSRLLIPQLAVEKRHETPLIKHHARPDPTQKPAYNRRLMRCNRKGIGLRLRSR